MHLDVKETKLDNGIRIVTSHMPHAASVAMGLWVGVGGRYEKRSTEGMSHFLEHLLFKGTKTRSARAISQAIEGRGGYFNAFTQEESTCYYARIGARHVWKMATILSDMYRNPRLSSRDIDKERGVIIEEIMMYRDQPHQVADEMLGGMIWHRHPLGRPLIGPPKNILRFTRDEIAGFKQGKYNSENTVISLAGCVDHQEAVKKLGPVFTDLIKQKRPGFRSVSRDTPQQAFAQQEKKIEQTHLSMGIRIFGRDDKRRYALKLLSVMLGENMSSRLFQVVREKHGLAYSIHSSIHLFSDTGVLSVSAGLDRNKAQKALDLIIKELNRFKKRMVSASELRRAKDYAIGQLQMSMESTTSQMSWMGGQILHRNRYEQPADLIRKLEAVQAEEIMKLARQVLKSGKTSIAIVCPEDGSISEDRALHELAGL